MIFERKKINEQKMCVLIFSTAFVWNISHSKGKIVRYDQKYMLVFTQSTRNSWPILIKLEFSRKIFEKYSNIKFHENPFSGSRVVPYGRTHMTKLTAAFHNFANAPTSWAYICTELHTRGHHPLYQNELVL